jgi:serine/threonine protein kinase
LAADGHVVLTDFGFSRLFDEGEEEQQYDVLDNNRRLPYHTRTFCGTPHYMSPEIFLSEEYTYAVDYWSLGIVMYEMLLGCTPFDADNDAELYRRVLEDPVDIPENIPPATADLILGLLERNPEDRIGCASFFDSSDSDSEFYHDSMVGQKDIRQHPYFDGLDWSDVYNKRLPAPFVPRLKSDTDVSHFDPDFVKLSPRLSVTHRHEDDLDDLDDDPYGLDPEAYDSKTWANKYNNKHGGGFDDDDDQIPLDQAFIGYSYINEDTCVDTDSLLDEDEDKGNHDVAFTHGQHINDDNNSAPLMAHDSTRLVVLEGNHRASHYYDSPCPAIITSPATTVASTPMASSYHYYHQQQQLTVPEKGLSAKPDLPSSSQQLGFSRFQRRHDQQQVRLSSSFTLTSLQSDSDDVVWLQ